MKLKSWLQLFRAQTAPATLLCTLVPYLHNAPFLDLRSLLLGVSAVLFHYFSFGANSLMDTAMGYDRRDPSKQHHPLVSGVIELHKAHNVIHWGLAILTAWASVLTLWISPSPAIAMAALILWVAFGHGYNDGLSKESSFGFLSISICFTSMAAWAWLLTHKTLGYLGMVYVGYVFFTIMFQTSWSGFIKEMQIRERSNILTRMGALLEVGKGKEKGEQAFKPGKSRFYAYSIKGFNLVLGGLLLYLRYSLVRLVWYVFLVAVASFYLHRLAKPRVYERGKELLHMSLEEIATIYLPIPLMLGLVEASTLMLVGMGYFFGCCLLLWGKPYPKV